MRAATNPSFFFPAGVIIAFTFFVIIISLGFLPARNYLVIQTFDWSMFDDTPVGRRWGRTSRENWQKARDRTVVSSGK